MSVKLEQKETIRTTTGPRAGPSPSVGSKEDLAHKVGNALTQGSGPDGYLAVSTSPRRRQHADTD
jgi:hypothetical protein